VAVGVCSALTRQDYLFGNHRSHGHYLAKGGSLAEMVAEIFCREAGCSHGRGGSMHLIAPEAGMLGSAPIVSGTISLAVGAALAAAIRGDGRVAVACFGDGATGEGVLCESLNFAALRKLPLIFVCENNLYATHMPIRECRLDPEISALARSFGIESRRLDGNDVLAVQEAALEAAGRCRRGEGPVFLECLTYRFRGHVGPDDNIQGTHTDIRPPEEVAAWLERDPLARLRAAILSGGAAEGALTEIETDVGQEVAAAFAAARSGARPLAADLERGIFAANSQL
jgi:pyruvate dehydrogenase E1 component alpha subunit